MNSLFWLGLLLFASGIAGLIGMLFEKPMQFEPEVKILVDNEGNLIPFDTARI